MHGKQWAVGSPDPETGVVPVWPLEDAAGHDVDSLACRCGPRLKHEGTVLVHNAFDGREFLEVPAARN